ncbi:MAG TPA: amino acid adenylation domain-containing protein, partial [Thermoanaerobaculia bacterium]|nr:amino acid adenylation domain-containing protein [Thermoanaerobaculia bacterium]
PRPVLELPGLCLSAWPTESGTAKFDLSLALAEAGGELGGSFQYATDLFDPSTMGRLAGHLAVLLAGAVLDPEGALCDLPLLSAAERHQVLVEGQGEQSEELAAGLLHTAFRQQARRRPQAVAAVFAGETLTYGELSRKARCLAVRLRRLGVGPESRVALCLERSLDLVVALLGVLEAGAAYVPLDPSHPVDRLRWLWEDSGAEVLLGGRDLPDLGIANEQIIDPSQIGLEDSGDDAIDAAAPDNLAYVMYTSGTTGRPKGVMVPHRGVVNHLRWRQAEYGLGESDVLVHKAPLGFDASVWEILWPLSVGARLVVALPGGHQDVGYLVDLVRQEKVTFLHAVPSLLRILVEEEGLAECTSLRWVTTGGEPLPVEVREKFFCVLGAELLHGYGPTEASIGVTYGPCERGNGRATTLGRPIANAEIYLLDWNLSPVPLGVPGELCIGGVGLARGYLGRPGLTAERFVPHPSSSEPGARLYRSGDLVRRRADGGLEFLGRIDHQIKIRGMRVEPAEIEAVLLSLPGVREAIVLPREERAGDQRLVAYVAGVEGLAPSSLRAQLAGKLPQHMVPSAVVVLDVLPLMANGKVDRLALARIEPQSTRDEAASEGLDPVQEITAGIWCEVLHVERVGAEDNFFELGGHSLLATQVVSRLQQAFGIELPLRTLFEAPRLDELAARVAEAALRPGPALPPVERVGRT